MADTFATITSLSTFLDSLTDKLDKFFKNLEKSSQSIVDKECVNASNYINDKIAQHRAKVISGLKEQYSSSAEMTGVLKVLAEPPSVDLGAIGSYLSSLATYFTKPYQEAIAYKLKLVAAIEKLTTSFTKIASYEPPQSKISYSKFQIKANPISISDIISGGTDSGDTPIA